MPASCNTFFWKLKTVHSIQCIIKNIHCTLQCTVHYTVHCTLHSTLYSTLYKTEKALYTDHCKYEHISLDCFLFPRYMFYPVKYLFFFLDIMFNTLYLVNI